MEIKGPDGFAFTNLLTSRDLTQCKVGQGKYVLITGEDGGIINDPVLLRLGENHFWLALADSDVLLWAKGLAVNSGMDVTIHEPDVSPIQIQGPKSKEVVKTLFGEKVLQLKYYFQVSYPCRSSISPLQLSGYLTDRSVRYYMASRRP